MSNSKKLIMVALSLMLACGLGLSACSTPKTDSSTNNNNSTAGNNNSSSTSQGTGNSTANSLGLVNAGKLTIGSDCDYPPFISMQDGKPVGFEYELMQAISKDMGLELNYLPPQNFDTLVASVAGGGKMDLAVSSITVKDDRAKLVDFTITYCDSNQACVTLKSSSFKSTSDLAGKVVGAQSGTTGEGWAKENLKGATVKGFNQTSEGLAALRSGDIDALFFDEPVAKYQVNNTYTDCQVLEVIPTGEQYAFAVSKDNPTLKNAVNASLQKLMDNGTFDQLFYKYFKYHPTLHKSSN